MAPAEPGQNQSQLNIFTISPGEHSLHCNKYQRLKVEEFTADMYDSSLDRLQTFSSFMAPKTREDVIIMLGDTSGKRHQVFRDREVDFVKTVAVGIFDCVKRTWSLYSDNPKTNDPLVVLPLVLKESK